MLTTLPQSGQNVSLSIAPALKMRVIGGGGGWKNYYHNGVGEGAEPGCLLEGGGGQNCQNVSLLLCEPYNFAPALKKSLTQRGGGG